MHADELHTAVTKIVKLLEHADVRTAVDQYRASKGDQRTAAAARLQHAGALLIEQFDSLSPAERQVVKCMHLESLGETKYWQLLMAGNMDKKTQQAEIVRLASRVMFAGNHLPGILSLLSDVADSQQASAAATPVQTDDPLLVPLGPGEGAFFIRLTDAGEKASDPDRIARAIDGIDMLYSACASIARKPAIDLRLDTISTKENRDRDFRFTGDQDSVSAVFAVVDAIPAALAQINPEQDIDLDAVVRSLPIFKDLHTLASLGTFSGNDLKDISETMHQGALLALESGVILIDEQMVAQAASEKRDQPEVESTIPVMKKAASPAPSALEGSDGNETAPSTHVIKQPAVTKPAAVTKPVAETKPITETKPIAETRVNAERRSIAEIKPTTETKPSAAESDEHYNRYLREREAMMKPKTERVSENGVNGHSNGAITSVFTGAETGVDEQTRKDAVDELLRSLDQSRSS